MTNFRKQCDEIPVPENLNLLIDAGIKTGRKRMAGKKAAIIISVSLFAMIFMTGTVNYFPSVAVALSEVPFVGSIANNLMHGEFELKDHTDLIEQMDQRKSVGNTTFTLKEAYYDRETFIFGFDIQGLDEYDVELLDKDGVSHSLSSYKFIDGELFYGLKPIGGTSLDIIRSENGNAAYGILQIDNRDILPKKCNLSLIIKDTKGDKKRFAFNVPVNYSKVDEQTKIFNMAQEFERDEVKIIIDKLTFTPVQIVLNYEYIGEKNNAGYLYKVQLVDENNAVINLNTSTTSGPTQSLKGAFIESRYNYRLPEGYENIKINITDQQNNIVASYDPSSY